MKEGKFFNLLSLYRQVISIHITFLSLYSYLPVFLEIPIQVNPMASLIVLCVRTLRARTRYFEGVGKLQTDHTFVQ